MVRVGVWLERLAPNAGLLTSSLLNQKQMFKKESLIYHLVGCVNNIVTVWNHCYLGPRVSSLAFQHGTG